MKYLRILGLLIGVVLILLLGHQVGWASIRETLTLLGWNYLIVLVYPLTWMTLNTAGWYYARHPSSPPIPFRVMAEIRIAGETFNSLLPSSYVGGEPVKAKLLSTWTPLREATASVMIAKAGQSVGLLLFIGLGLAIGIPPSASTADKWKAWIALGVLATGVSIFILLLANGSFSRLGRLLHQVTRWGWLQAQERRLIALDESLGSFYRECKGRFLASILWHGAGWIAGMLELVIIFKLMGVPISWQQAWFMGALAQLGSVIGLISPGGLGFYEGGHYMAAVILGLPPSLGVSASLIRRVREIFWSIVGLYYFSKHSRQTASMDNRQ
jgi:glycosyltransferase 2 family protein